MGGESRDRARAGAEVTPVDESSTSPPPGVGGTPAAPLTAADVLALLCRALDDLLGGAATVCLLRRAVRRSAARCPEVVEIAVTRDRFIYRYAAPASWSRGGVDADRALGDLMGEMRTLLVELTGPVALVRLHAIPELAQRGHFAPEVDP